MRTRTYAEINREQCMTDVSYIKSFCPEYQGTGNCTAIALCALTGMGFDEAVYSLYDSTGKPPGRFGWLAYQRAVQNLGYSMTETGIYTAKTLITAERDPYLARGRYILSVSGGRHAVGMVDGKVIDWSNGRRHRIHRVYKFEEA